MIISPRNVPSVLTVRVGNRDVEFMLAHYTVGDSGMAARWECDLPVVLYYDNVLGFTARVVFQSTYANDTAVVPRGNHKTPQAAVDAALELGQKVLDRYNKDFLALQGFELIIVR